MGLLDILTFPFLGPIKGVVWVADKLSEQAENEIFNADAVSGQLMELELRFDLGEITEQEFLEAEESLLERLKFIREYYSQEEE